MAAGVGRHDIPQTRAAGPRAMRAIGPSAFTPSGSDRIPFSELERMLKDINIPDSALRPYLTGDRTASRPFAPAIQADLNRVALDDMDRFRVEGAFAMNWANGIARWRRQAKFKRRRLLGSGGRSSSPKAIRGSSFPCSSTTSSISSTARTTSGA
jgi:hypothetical protein